MRELYEAMEEGNESMEEGNERTIWSNGGG